MSDQILERFIPSLPPGWKRVNIGQCLEEISKPIIMRDSESYHLVSIRRRGEGMFYRGTLQGREILTKTLQEVIPNSFVVARMQVVHGATALALPKFSGAAISKSYSSFIGTSICDVNFFSWLAKHPLMYAYYADASQGIVIEKMTFDQSRWLSFPIFLPPIAEQRAIAKVLDAADEAINSTGRLIAKLEQVKQGLLHDLLTLGIDEDLHFRDINLHPEMFKDTPIGRIPNSWEVVPVGEVGDVLLGRQRSPQHQKGRFPVPYLRVANVFDGLIDYSDVLSMNFTPREQQIYGLRSGDLLLNEGQSLELVGRCAIYVDQPKLHCFQNTLVRYRCSESLNSKFAYLTFKHWLALGRFMQVAKKTTSMAHLGASRFAAMSIAIPTLTEQRKIVAAFDSFERRIAFEYDQLMKQKMIKQGLMDDLLTGRVRVGDAT